MSADLQQYHLRGGPAVIADDQLVPRRLSAAALHCGRCPGQGALCRRRRALRTRRARGEEAVHRAAPRPAGRHCAAVHLRRALELPSPMERTSHPAAGTRRQDANRALCASRAAAPTSPSRARSGASMPWSQRRSLLLRPLMMLCRSSFISMATARPTALSTCAGCPRTVRRATAHTRPPRSASTARCPPPGTVC
eukprot:scaffold4613_cov129-Isochrysis_galbana.AAC.32